MTSKIFAVDIFIENNKESKICYIDDLTDFQSLKERLFELDAIYYQPIVEISQTIYEGYVTSYTPHNKDKVFDVLKRHNFSFGKLSIRFVRTYNSSNYKSKYSTMNNLKYQKQMASYAASDFLPNYSSLYSGINKYDTIQEEIFWTLSGMAVMQGNLSRKIEINRNSDVWRDAWYMLIDNRLWMKSNVINNERVETKHDLYLSYLILNHNGNVGEIEPIDSVTFSLVIKSQLSHNGPSKGASSPKIYFKEVFKATNVTVAKKWIQAFSILFSENSLTPTETFRNDENDIFELTERKIMHSQTQFSYQQLSSFNKMITLQELLSSKLLRDNFVNHLKTERKILYLSFWQYLKDFRMGHPSSKPGYNDERLNGLSTWFSNLTTVNQWAVSIYRDFIEGDLSELSQFNQVLSDLKTVFKSWNPTDMYPPNIFDQLESFLWTELKNLYEKSFAHTADFKHAVLTLRSEHKRKQKLNLNLNQSSIENQIGNKRSLRFPIFNWLTVRNPQNEIQSQNINTSKPDYSEFIKEILTFRNLLPGISINSNLNLNPNKRFKIVLPDWWWVLAIDDIDFVDLNENFNYDELLPKWYPKDHPLLIKMSSEIHVSSPIKLKKENYLRTSPVTSPFTSPVKGAEKDPDYKRFLFKLQDEILNTNPQLRQDISFLFNLQFRYFEEILLFSYMRCKFYNTKRSPSIVRSMRLETNSISESPSPLPGSSKRSDSIGGFDDSYFDSSKIESKLSLVDLQDAVDSSITPRDINLDFELDESSFRYRSTLGVKRGAAEDSLAMYTRNHLKQLAVLYRLQGRFFITLVDPLTNSITSTIRLDDICKIGPADKVLFAIEMYDEHNNIWQLSPEGLDESDTQKLASRWLNYLWSVCSSPTMVYTVIKRGYLQKRGKVNTAFKWRWFELGSDLKFRYFKDPVSKIYKGQIDLVQLDSFSLDEKSIVKQDKELVLYMNSSIDRAWILRAENSEEASSWLKVLHSLLSCTVNIKSP